MTIAEHLIADPKATARMIRRRRVGQNVAFRREDGRLDCFSFADLDKAQRFADVRNGRLV